jgi:hypothetical protein
MKGMLLRRLGALSVLLPVLCACVPERSRAVRASAAEPAKDTKDYHAMLTQARERAAAEDTLGPILAGLEKFRGERGRLPTNLQEMVQSRTLAALPRAPAGLTYVYDARSGNVRLAPAGEQGRIKIPEDDYQPPSLLKN